MSFGHLSRPATASNPALPRYRASTPGHLATVLATWRHGAGEQPAEAVTLATEVW